MKLTDKGVSDQLVADMRTMLEGHLSEEPFNANAALKKQRIKGMQDKLENLRTQRQRADDSAKEAREQGRDDAADGHEEKGDRINNNIRDLKAKIRDEMNEDNTNDKSDDGEGLDKVKKDAVKKKFADRKDKDIDNDGDTDSSDEYLHKKRQAISKKMDEGELPPALQKAIDKKKGKDSDDEDEKEVEESSRSGGANSARWAANKAKNAKNKKEEVKEGELPPALKKAIAKKKGDEDEKEVEEGKDKIKYRGNLKDLKAMKEDFMIIIEKYGLDQVKTIINSIEK